ncbi:MAG: tetratricopeptide repeat protein [Sphingobacteriaceae bacterium]|nr:tetratricopeptide repeat protein [Cytophagaceae bacterium]
MIYSGLERPGNGFFTGHPTDTKPTYTTRFPGIDTTKRGNNQAVLLARKGNYKAALPMLLRLGTSNDTVRYNLALIELQLRHAERAAQLFRSTPGFALASFNLGVAECVKGDYENGLLDLASSPHTSLTSDKLAYNKGLANLRLNALDGRDNVSQAEQLFRDAVRMKPGELRYRTARGDALMTQKRYDEALRHYRQALDETSHPALYAQMGQASLALGKYEEAVEFFEEYLRSTDRSRHLSALLGLGHAYYRQKAFPQALMQYQKAVKLDGTCVRAQVSLANVLCSQQKYRAAAHVYDLALRLDSTDQRAHLGRAVTAFRTGEYKAAVTHFRRAGEAIDPRNREHFDFFVSQGFSILRAGGRGQDAEPHFQTALKLNNKSPIAYAGLSEAHIRANSFTAALDYAELALKRDYNNDHLLTNRGNLLFKFDDFDKAHQTYLQAAARNPHNLNALNGVGYTLMELDRLDQARRLYDSLIVRHPKAFLFNNRGIVKSYLGLRSEKAKDLRAGQNYYHLALQDFGRAQELDTVRRFYNNNAGNVYKNISDFDNAIRSYEAYLSKNAINNMGVMFANAAKEKFSQHYLNIAVKLDSSSLVFLYNRSRLYYQYFKDSLAARKDIQAAASLKQFLPPNSITSKYSKDGYITVYLVDYEWDKYEFPGDHFFTVEAETAEQNDFLPALDFVEMPYESKALPKSPTYARTKVKHLREGIRRTKRWGSTKCP